MTTYDALITGYSPLGRWKCNDTVGSTSAADSSGNSKPLSVFNGTSITFGVSGPPIGVPGATCATLPSSGTPYMIGASQTGSNAINNITALGWVKISGNTAGPLIFVGGSGASSGWGIGVGGSGSNAWTTGNQGELLAALVGGVAWEPPSGAPSLSTGTWHMLAMVLPASGAGIALYLDGVSEYSNTSTQAVAGSLSTSIGSDQSHNGNLAGNICELATIPSSLNATQLLALYTAGTTALPGVSEPISMVV